MKQYLACDLGAESGRLILGRLAQGRLELEEVRRFRNEPVKKNGALAWDVEKLWRELQAGLGGGRRGKIESVSADSWGVDYLLFRADGRWIEPVYHYRDPRAELGVRRVFDAVPWPVVFRETGIQFMPLNTLFQLAAETAGRLEQADFMLGIGDGFNYLLSGQPWAEQSLASTTQLYNPRARTWSDHLIRALGFPRKIFPPVIPSGTRLGSLRAEIAKQAGWTDEVAVVAACSHDTGAAVAAVPARGRGWAYLSSGTWSLMGVELPRPIISDPARELNFTNEIGYGGSIRLLKNISGLWIIQECRREWARAGKEFSYGDLTQMAEAAPSFVSLIDPTDPRFLAPDNMPAKVAEFCRETGQPAPQTPGAAVRCALESLALLYRRTLVQIETLIGEKIERLHVVGGGSKNQLLNRFTADAIGRPLVVGPSEATAAGNILIQAIALGELKDLDAARDVARRSFAPKELAPEDPQAWEAPMQRFDALKTTARSP